VTTAPVAAMSVRCRDTMTPVEIGPELGDLSDREIALVQDARSDDVAFVWVLIHLGLRGNPPSHPDWRPGPNEIESAFATLERLERRGLVEVGRVEHIDGGAPGRVTAVRHVAEPLAVVRERVEEAVALASAPMDWEFSCWVVATPGV